MVSKGGYEAEKKLFIISNAEGEINEVIENVHRA